MSTAAMLLKGTAGMVAISGAVTEEVQLCAIPLYVIDGCATTGFAVGESISVTRSGTAIGSLSLERIVSASILAVSKISGDLPAYGDTLTGADSSATCTLTAINLFPDPGVESGRVSGWSEDSTAVPIADTTIVRSGKFSLHIIGGTQNNFTTRSVTVEIGKQYTFSAWKMGGDLGSSLRLGTVAYGQQYASSMLLGNKTSWTQESVTFTATASTLYVSIGAGSKYTDGGYWDDFKLEVSVVNMRWVDLSASAKEITVYQSTFSVSGSRAGELAFIGAANGYAAYPDLGMSVGPVWFEMVCTIETTAEIRCAPSRFPFLQMKSVNRIPSLNVQGTSSWATGTALVSGQYYRLRGDLVLKPGGGAALRLWVDGELVSSLDLAGISATALGSNYIAAACDATMKWTGKISEFVVGNGTPIPYGVAQYQGPKVRWGMG